MANKPELYLPYQFIPVTGRIGDHATEKRSYEDSKHHTRHDLWLKGRVSGRLICRLETHAPVCVGNQHTQRSGDPTIIQHYRIDDRLAIPGNSLRGAIGSILETLSQSTLRVLDDEFLPAFNSIDPDLCPWNSQRDQLTPAEQILGVAEDVANQAHAARNLASRTSFSDARLDPDAPPPAPCKEVLKVLSNPKPLEIPDNHVPNRPSTYFYGSKPNKGIAERIDKDEAARLLEAGDQSLFPAGRKVYLRHGIVDDYSETRSASDQNVEAELLPNESTLWFHVDFDNLDVAEMTLLQHAIAPSKYFFHQIGLGKALGLGKCRISPAALFLRIPSECYAADASLTAKYSTYYLYPSGGGKGWGKLDGYVQESKALDTATCCDSPPEDDARLIDLDTRAILLQLGDQSIGAMQQNTKIRWRDGRAKGEEEKEPAKELKPLRPGWEIPTLYGEPGRCLRVEPLEGAGGSDSVEAELEKLISATGGDMHNNGLARAICDSENAEALFKALLEMIDNPWVHIGNKAQRTYKKRGLQIPLPDD